MVRELSNILALVIDPSAILAIFSVPVDILLALRLYASKFHECQILFHVHQLSVTSLKLRNHNSFPPEVQFAAI